MTDLNVPTAVRAMLDRSAALAADGDPADVPLDGVVVDLTDPPRRSRRALAGAAAALLVAGAVGLAVARGGEERERASVADAPPAEAQGPPSDAGEEVPAAIQVEPGRLTVLALDLVPEAVLDSAPETVEGGRAVAVEVRISRGASFPSAEDRWGGAVRLATGEPAALVGTGAGRRVEVDAGDLLITVVPLAETSDEEVRADVEALELDLR